MPNIAALDRLKSQLLTSGLSQQNSALFQVINQLIDFLRQTINTTTSRINSLSSTSSTTIINSSNNSSLLPLDFTEDLESPLYIPGPQGLRGLTGPIGPPGLDSCCEEYSDISISGLFQTPYDGEWLNVPYDSTNFFTDSAVTWTVDSGDQVSFAYMMIRKTMIIRFSLNNTSVSGSTFTLRIKIPAGRIVKTGGGSSLMFAIRAINNGTEGIGFNEVRATDNFIRCYNAGFANWAASTNNTFVQGLALFEVD